MKPLNYDFILVAKKGAGMSALLPMIILMKQNIIFTVCKIVIGIDSRCPKLSLKRNLRLKKIHERRDFV